MILVDAYKMYELEDKERNSAGREEPLLSFRNFHDQIALQLIKNQFSTERTSRKHQRELQETVAGEDEETKCQLLSLTQRTNKTGKKKYKQLRCSICSHHCSFYCLKCSTDTNIVAMCAVQVLTDLSLALLNMFPIKWTYKYL
jgi:hypothetical protein